MDNDNLHIQTENTRALPAVMTILFINLVLLAIDLKYSEVTLASTFYNFLIAFGALSTIASVKIYLDTFKKAQ